MYTRVTCIQVHVQTCKTCTNKTKNLPKRQRYPATDTSFQIFPITRSQFPYLHAIQRAAHVRTSDFQPWHRNLRSTEAEHGNVQVLETLAGKMGCHPLHLLNMKMPNGDRDKPLCIPSVPLGAGCHISLWLYWPSEYTRQRNWTLVYKHQVTLHLSEFDKANMLISLCLIVTDLSLLFRTFPCVLHAMHRRAVSCTKSGGFAWNKSHKFYLLQVQSSHPSPWIPSACFRSHSVPALVRRYAGSTGRLWHGRLGTGPRLRAVPLVTPWVSVTVNGEMTNH